MFLSKKLRFSGFGYIVKINVFATKIVQKRKKCYKCYACK